MSEAISVMVTHHDTKGETMRYAMLVSGNGGFSKFVYHNSALITEGELGAVIADRNCHAIQFFENETPIPSFMFDFKSYESRDDFEAEILAVLAAQNIDALFLTYDRVVGQGIISAYRNRIFNLHLSLLPLFKGTRAQQTIESSYNSDMLFFGATVHLVDEFVDSGSIISQVIIPKTIVEDIPGYTQRLFENAALLLLDTIGKICAGQLVTEGSRPLFSNAEYGTGNFNPSLSIDVTRTSFSHFGMPSVLQTQDAGAVCRQGTDEQNTVQ